MGRRFFSSITDYFNAINKVIAVSLLLTLNLFFIFMFNGAASVGKGISDKPHAGPFN
jgi:hypothetical protein